MRGSLFTLLAFASCQGRYAGQVASPISPSESQSSADSPTAAPLAPAAAAPTQVTSSDADKLLASRTLDYGQALRAAALKLVGTLPTLDEQNSVVDADSYLQQINVYLSDPRLARQLIVYFENMMRVGGARDANLSRDTAPTFAAEVVIEDRPFTDVFTATEQTCPQFDGTTFTPKSCMCEEGNSTKPCGPAVGVLTDPGVMELYYGNLAFRRTRWVQETFACSKFPAEFSAMPVPMGDGEYTSTWPFHSIADGADPTKSHVNFQDVSSVICANCHTTLNHIAPLFAMFDALGTPSAGIAVNIPQGQLALRTDWLPDGESTAWRYGTPVTTLTDLGNAMAADDDVAECQVARAWNWAMDKLDIVNDAQTVPAENVASLKALYVASNYNVKTLLRAVFTHDDFVRF